jgi:hypothetical protein
MGGKADVYHHVRSCTTYKITHFIPWHILSQHRSLETDLLSISVIYHLLPFSLMLFFRYE